MFTNMLNSVKNSVGGSVLKAEKLLYTGGKLFRLRGVPFEGSAILFTVNGVIYFTESDVVYDPGTKTFTWNSDKFDITPDDTVVALYSEDSNPERNGAFIGEVSDVLVSTRGNSVILTWKDPSSRKWMGTKVVRKVGSAPLDIDDGELILDVVKKNTYLTEGYTDPKLKAGTTYYYGLFTYGASGKAASEVAAGVEVKGKALTNNPPYYMMQTVYPEDYDTMASLPEVLDTSQLVDMSCMFMNCVDLISPDVSSFDTRNAHSMGGMFMGCSGMESLDLSSFDTSNVESMVNMFSGCESLAYLDLSSFNTRNVTEMNGMFSGCKNLPMIDLSSFDMSNVKNMFSMFRGCSSLESLDLSSFSTVNAENMQYMFAECPNLEKIHGYIDCSSLKDYHYLYGMFTGSKVSSITFRRVKESFIPAITPQLLKGENGEITVEFVDVIKEDPLMPVSDADVIVDRNIAKLTWKDPSGDSRFGATTIVRKEGSAPVSHDDGVVLLDRCMGSWYQTNPLEDKDLDLGKTYYYGFFPRSPEGWYSKGSETIIAVTPDGSVMLTNSPQYYHLRDVYTAATAQEMIAIPDKFNTSRLTNMSEMFYSAKKLTAIDLSNFVTTKVTNMANMFNGCETLTELDVSAFNTSHVANMGGMFQNCRKLTSLDLSGFVLPATSCQQMFSGCESLTSIEMPETFKATSTNSMFNDCESLEAIDVSGMDMTEDITGPTRMFQGCRSLTSVKLPKSVNVTKNTYASNMFKDCENLESIDLSGFQVACARDMVGMFQGCKKLAALDLSGFKTTEMESMARAFQDCESLTSLDLTSFDTSHVHDTSFMFSGCDSLASLNLSSLNMPNLDTVKGMFDGCESMETLAMPAMNTSKVKDFQYMFRNCKSLESVDVSGFNTASAEHMSEMFAGCESMNTIDLKSFNTAKVEDFAKMFQGCTSLRIVDGVFDCAAIKDKFSMNDMFKGTKVISVTLRHVGASMVPAITSQALKGDDTLEINFVDVIPEDHIQDVSNEVVETGSNLAVIKWTDPDDDRWFCTKVVRKEGSAPDTSADGTLVVNSSTKNAYRTDGFVDKGLLPETTYYYGFFPSMNTGWEALGKIVTATTQPDSVLLTNSNPEYYKMSQVYPNLYNTMIDVHDKLNTSQLTSMHEMFCDCQALTTVDISGFDASKTVDMSGMFTNCKSLKSIQLSGFDTSNAENMSNMFYGCTSLEEVKGVFDFSKVTMPSQVSDMFTGTKVTSVSIRNVEESLKRSITPEAIKNGGDITINFINEE